MTVGEDGAIRALDLNGSVSAAFSLGTRAISARITANAKRIVIDGAVWDASASRLLHRYQFDSVFSPDATRVLTLTKDNIGQVRETENGRLIGTLAGHMCPKPFTNAHFSPNNMLIVAPICNEEDESVQPFRVWDANDGRVLTMLTLPKGKLFLREEPFSPDGKLIVTGSLNGTYSERIWYARTGRQLTSMLPYNRGIFIPDAIFSPNGRLIATSADNGTVLVWDAHNGHLVSSLAADSGFGDVKFSPNSKRILTVSEDSIELWDADTGILVNTLPKTGNIGSSRFSPDGKRIITVDRGGTARIYIVGFDELLKRAKQHLPIERGK